MFDVQIIVNPVNYTTRFTDFLRYCYVDFSVCVGQLSRKLVLFKSCTIPLRKIISLTSLGFFQREHNHPCLVYVRVRLFESNCAAILNNSILKDWELHHIFYCGGANSGFYSSKH